LRQACVSPSNLVVPIAVLIILIASPVLFRAFTTQSTLTEASLNNFARWYTKQRAPSPDPDLVPASGVRLVIFADYQCPSSASVLPKIVDIAEQFRQKTGESLEVVVRDFPIDSSCNPGYWASLHPAACEAAAAVRFLNQTHPDETTRAFEQWLRDNRAALTPSLINEYLSTRAPAMAARFDKERASLIAQVRRDAIRGLSLGVSRTPTFFVNGVKIPHPIYLEAAVLLQLKREPYAGLK
jgi:protein-disulfide isomerase